MTTATRSSYANGSQTCGSSLPGRTKAASNSGRRSTLNATPLFVLTGRALVLVARHAVFYAAVATAAIALEWVLFRFVRDVGAIDAATIVIGAAVDAAVLARTKADVDGTGNPWARAFERFWAVVIANFASVFLTEYGIALAAAPQIGTRLLGVAVLPFAAATIFAEAIAVTTDDERWWFLPLHALGASLRTAWTGATMWRVLALFAVSLVPTVIAAAIEPLLRMHHLALASFWSSVPLGILVSIPLDVLIVLALFDAWGYAPNPSCDE